MVPVRSQHWPGAQEASPGRRPFPSAPSTCVTIFESPAPWRHRREGTG